MNSGAGWPRHSGLDGCPQESRHTWPHDICERMICGGTPRQKHPVGERRDTTYSVIIRERNKGTGHMLKMSTHSRADCKTMCRHTSRSAAGRRIVGAKVELSSTSANEIAASSSVSAQRDKRDRERDRETERDREDQA